MGSKQRPTPVEEAGVASTAIDLVAGLASATVKDDDEAAQEAARAHAHALRDIHVVVITECEVKLGHSVYKGSVVFPMRSLFE